MSEEKRLRCDIRGRYETTAKPVRPVRVRVEIQQDRNDDESWSIAHTTMRKDMCPDAIVRAIKFADRAVTPPTKPQPAEGAPETTQ